MKYPNENIFWKLVTEKINGGECDEFKKPVYPVNVLEKEKLAIKVAALLKKQGFTFIRI